MVDDRVKKIINTTFRKLMEDEGKMKDLVLLAHIPFKLDDDELEALCRYHKMIAENAVWREKQGLK